MHIHNGETQMNVACLPPGHYMAAISIVYSGGAESLNGRHERFFERHFEPFRASVSFV
jgi:hypothetical protein